MFLSALPCHAELPPLVPREVLFGNPEKTAPDISPDGRELSYLAPDSKGVLNVWVKTIGKDDDRVITQDKLRGVRSAWWQEDGKHVIYLQDLGGDENWHIYQTNVATKLTRDLTPFLGVQAQIVGSEPEFPTKLLCSMNARNLKFHDVYNCDLETGALTLNTENPGDVTQWSADHELNVRGAIAVNKDATTEIRVRDTVSSPWRTVLKWGPDEMDGSIIGFTADNKKLLVCTSVDANAQRLVEIDLASGKQSVVAEDPDFDISNFLIAPKTHELMAVSFEKQRCEWKVLDKAVEADFEAIKKINPGDLAIPSQDLSNKKWIVSFSPDNGPASHYLYDRESKKETFLFANKPKLEKYQLASMKPIEITARDGMKLHAYLTLPVGVKPEKLPLVLLVHGGPWARDMWGFSSTGQWLANRGFAVLQVNYRGSSGYGKKYLHAGDKEWAGKMHTDLIDAKDWAIKEGYADPSKICIFGGSYGGYSALVGATFTPDDFSCAVDMVGPSNLVTLLNSIPPYWETERAIFDKRLGNPNTDKAFLEERSPLFKADKIKIPMLIAQGANDPRVKIAESDQIVAAIRKNGKTVDYMVFPDEGHGFARPENRVKFYAHAEAFLAKHLGGRKEDVGAKEAAGDLLK